MNLVKLWKGTEQTRMNELDCFGWPGLIVVVEDRDREEK